MWKVLIVDDSYPVLEFLAEIIPWDSLNMTLVGMHLNGRKALDYCKHEMPDILITDIGMPEMDGIDLIKAAKQIDPRLRVIILSCHEEFRYVQQAVKLNVSDYILKETMQPEMIIELLRTLQLNMEQERQELENRRRLEVIVDQNSSLLKEKFIQSTLANPIHDTGRWLLEARQFGIELAKQHYVPVLCFANRYRELKQRYQTEELFKYAFANGINELIDNKVGGVSFPYTFNEIILLIPLRTKFGRKSYDELVCHLATVQIELETCLKVRTSFIISKAANTPQELKLRLKELTESKNLRFYANPKSIFQWEAFQCSNDDIFKYFSQASDELKQFISEGTLSGMEDLLDRWVHFIRKYQFEAEEVRGWVIKLLSDIELKYRSQQQFQNTYSAEVLHYTLLELDSLEEMFDYIKSFLINKVKYIASVLHESQRKEVVEAKRYVLTHLSQKIGLEEVAHSLHLNASHFSRIFKQETGETFIEFVTRTKMERAQEYLLQSEKSVDEIAEMLGYDNTSYFIKLFKAFSGMSPANFRMVK